MIDRLACRRQSCCLLERRNMPHGGKAGEERWRSRLHTVPAAPGSFKERSRRSSAARSSVFIQLDALE
jgi:hypothetical protein